MSSLDASKSAATIADYDAVAAAFDAGNRDHDVSQNIDALLGAIAAGRAGDALGGVAVDRGADRPVIVDLGCAGGRDLVARQGHLAGRVGRRDDDAPRRHAGDVHGLGRGAGKLAGRSAQQGHRNRIPLG